VAVDRGDLGCITTSLREHGDGRAAQIMEMQIGDVGGFANYAHCSAK